jgi:hypothetical protein
LKSKLHRIHLVLVGILVFHQFKLTCVEQIFFLSVRLVTFLKADLEQSRCLENTSDS